MIHAATQHAGTGRVGRYMKNRQRRRDTDSEEVERATIQEKKTTRQKNQSIARSRRQETVTEQPRLARERRRDFDRRQSLVRSPKRVRGVVLAGTFTRVGRRKGRGRGCMKTLRLEGAREPMRCKETAAWSARVGR